MPIKVLKLINQYQGDYMMGHSTSQPNTTLRIPTMHYMLHEIIYMSKMVVGLYVLQKLPVNTSSLVVIINNRKHV